MDITPQQAPQLISAEYHHLMLQLMSAKYKQLKEMD